MAPADEFTRPEGIGREGPAFTRPEGIGRERTDPFADNATALLGGLTEMVTGANLGTGGLLGLQQAIELGLAATGAAGAAFVEYGEGTGRVVAACGAVEFLLGRPVDLPDPPTGDSDLREVPIGPGRLSGLGLRRMASVTAQAGTTPIGSIQLYFKDQTATVEEPARSWVGLLATCAAHLYADGLGLPVYESGPVLSPLAIAIAVVGPTGLVLSWNPAAERLTGRTATEAVGHHFPFRMPPPGRSVDHLMACGTWITIRATRLTGTDSVALAMRPQRDEVQRDQSQDLFVAVASHELRTPVTVIRGYADTLVEHWDRLEEPARREAVMVLGQRARELARLVDRLLTAASDAAGLPDGPVPVPFDVLETLREATADLTPEIRAGVALRLPVVLPKAQGDRAGVATVVTELVTNACKYSPARVLVEVTAGADAQTVWFRVSDRGVGIRPEHVERAFERFWQLESGDQRRYGGVGLGLYLVRRIVERQNGWVSLRPREAGGTVAEVRLPRADVRTGEV
jgi:two-component system phosphate regulon sensor histidine kinase PhoR